MAGAATAQPPPRVSRLALRTERYEVWRRWAVMVRSLSGILNLHRHDRNEVALIQCAARWCGAMHDEL